MTGLRTAEECQYGLQRCPRRSAAATFPAIVLLPQLENVGSLEVEEGVDGAFFGIGLEPVADVVVVHR
jgi:hypothetical protein